MTSLSTRLAWLIGQLQSWPVCREFQIVESQRLESHRFRIKVRAHLTDPYQLQVRYYHNRGHLDYSYQLFSDEPVLRWDNKEDVSDVQTAPHHFHTAEGAIVESPLIGNPEQDWPYVKTTIEQFMSAQSKPSDKPEQFDFLEF